MELLQESLEHSGMDELRHTHVGVPGRVLS